MIESSAPATQEALVEMLAEALDDVHVSFGRPGKLPKQTALVYVLPSRDWRLGSGEQLRIETYKLALAIECFGAGETAAAATDAARWDIIARVHDALRRADRYGYETKGLDFAVEENTLTLYDKGWVAYSVVTAGVERMVA